MVAFTCNVCGAWNRVERFATEPASCACGSNVRVRALVHLLSMELFGQSLPLPDFPRLRAIRGLGMTDKPGYAEILAEKFTYTNTQFDRPPRFDLRERHPELEGSFDFILAADVLEHIAPPVERALEEACRLLKPYGFFGVTVYCNPQDRLREHFPELHEYRVVPLGDTAVLVNRRRDGSLEVREDLVLHGGSGATLEMREFGISALSAALLGAGFREVFCLAEDLPEIGVLFDADVSQPLVARKEPFVMGAAAVSELMDQWRAARRRLGEQRETVERLGEQMRRASHSKWLRLGRRFGLGPELKG